MQGMLYEAQPNVVAPKIVGRFFLGGVLRMATFVVCAHTHIQYKHITSKQANKEKKGHTKKNTHT